MNEHEPHDELPPPPAPAPEPLGEPAEPPPVTPPPVTPPEAIRGRDLGTAASRLLHVNAMLAPERMQGPGFAFAMIPVLRRLYPDRERLGEAIARHTAYVSTHPLLSGYVLGAAVGLEEKRAAGLPVDGARIDAIQRALASPLAAMGDPFFWVVVRPVAGLLGVLSIAFLRFGDPDLPDPRVLLCPFILLLTYNAVALPTRWRGAAVGYAAADRPAELLRTLRLGEWREVFERAGAFLFGVLVALVGAGIRVSTGSTLAGSGSLGMALVPLGLGFVAARIVLRRAPASTVETAGLLAVLAALGSLAL